MLFPRSHAWTRLQKWLIACSVVLAIGVFALVVYTYERYHRGPDDSIIFGTWLNPITVADEPSYYEFRSDHRFVLFAVFDGRAERILHGRWFAGGQNIYLRYDEPEHSWPLILHIVDISSSEMRVRLARAGDIFPFRRVDPNSVPRI
jgi:hypothetical protein